MKLSECINEYIDKNRQYLKPRTVQTYKSRMPYILNIYGDLNIEEITQDYIQNKILELQDKGKTKQSINSNLTLLLISLKPYKSFERFRWKKTEQDLKQKEIYSKEDLDKIQKYILSKKKQSYLPILIAINTGMRIGEIQALKWEDLDLNKKIINVKRNGFFDKDEGCFVEQIPKSKSGFRRIPMTPVLFDYLKSIKFNNLEDYVVANKNKTRPLRAIQRTNELLLKKLGIKCLGFHTYRHSFATILSQNTANLKAVTEILGHSSVLITQNIYNHPTDIDKEKIINKVFGDNRSLYDVESQIKILQDELTKLLNLRAEIRRNL